MKKILLLIVVLVIVVPVALFQWKLAPQIGDLSVMINTIFGGGIDSPNEGEVRRTLRTPPGVGVSLFAADLKNARQMLMTAEDHLLVSTPRSGEVWLLQGDADGDGLSDGRRVLVSGLNRPHGMQVIDGMLYIAETDAVGRIAFDEADASVSGEFERVITGLPGGGNHWARNILAHDGWIYINIGSSCNVCIEEDSRRGTILRFRPDGSDEQVYATGLRNSMAMAVSPVDNQFYAADIARDLLGDDFPVDELNVIEQGSFYGWPLMNDFGVIDPDLGDSDPDRSRTAIPPVLGFPAHTSPLDIHFLQHPSWQALFPRSALVTLHGSWNRSEPAGYQVLLLSWGRGAQLGSRDFVTGFLQDGEVRGRPVDVVEASDGTLYLSDDYAGAVYAIQPGGDSDMAFAARNATTDASGKYDAELVAQGKALFDRYACAGCHLEGELSRGANLVPLRNLAARYSVDDLAAYLQTPNPPMPVFPLQAGERTSLATYLLQRERDASADGR